MIFTITIEGDTDNLLDTQFKLHTGDQFKSLAKPGHPVLANLIAELQKLVASSPQWAPAVAQFVAAVAGGTGNPLALVMQGFSLLSMIMSGLNPPPVPSVSKADAK